jgi:hypothetical protein
MFQRLAPSFSATHLAELGFCGGGDEQSGVFLWDRCDVSYEAREQAEELLEHLS